MITVALGARGCLWGRGQDVVHLCFQSSRSRRSPLPGLRGGSEAGEGDVMTADLAHQAEAFCEASIRDWTGRAARMLEATPEIAGYSFATAVILGDAACCSTAVPISRHATPTGTAPRSTGPPSAAENSPPTIPTPIGSAPQPPYSRRAPRPRTSPSHPMTPSHPAPKSRPSCAATANPPSTMAVVIDLAPAAQPVSLFPTRRRSAGRTGRRSARRGRWTRPGRARRRCRWSGAAAGSRTW